MALFSTQTMSPLASLGTQTPWLADTQQQQPATQPTYSQWNPLAAQATTSAAEPAPTGVTTTAPVQTTPAEPPAAKMPSLAELAGQMGIGMNGMGIYQPDKNGFALNPLTGRWMNPTEYEGWQMNQRDMNFGGGR